MYFLLISISTAYAEEQSEGWERLANMPEPRSESKALANNDKIYVVGGLNNKERSDNSMFVYDIKKIHGILELPCQQHCITLEQQFIMKNCM